MKTERGKGYAVMTGPRYNYSCLMDDHVAPAKLKARCREACQSCVDIHSRDISQAISYVEHQFSRLIDENDRKSYRQRRHKEYKAMLLVEMGGSFPQREKIIEWLKGLS